QVGRLPDRDAPVRPWRGDRAGRRRRGAPAATEPLAAPTPPPLPRGGPAQPPAHPAVPSATAFPDPTRGTRGPVPTPRPDPLLTRIGGGAPGGSPRRSAARSCSPLARRRGPTRLWRRRRPWPLRPPTPPPRPGPRPRRRPPRPPRRAP